MYQNLLVPIDDSNLSIDTAIKAVALAKTLGARITYLHAYPDYAATGEGALLHTLSPEDFKAREKGTAHAVVARAEAEARAHKVPSSTVLNASDRPYEAILDAALQHQCDLIFMASHGRRGVKGLLLGSQTQKVLMHTTIPVLVCTVETNAISPQMDAALTIIKREHRSLAAVIHGFKHVLQQARRSPDAADPALMAAMLHYFRHFTAGQHHPKEDAHLFTILRQRTDQANAILEELEAQHAMEAGFLDAIESAVQQYTHHPDDQRLDVLSVAVDHYAEHQWSHMSLEERSILPCCETHFLPEDWERVYRAFEMNGDPRFDKDRERGTEVLLAHLMEAAAASGSDKTTVLN